ncbi:MAG: hypothetical protein AB9846_06065 [Tenuifilaceae bacterium]
MRTDIKIGGEFEIDPIVLSDYPNFVPNKDILMFSSGRGALVFILKLINQSVNKTIHIPYYICPSVVDACKKGGFNIRFYELNSSFLLPLDYLSNINKYDVLLTVNYFGFIDDNPTIFKVKNLRPDITIISDQVQSFWTYSKTEADFSFTSLRKHFPLPEGALVYTKDNKICFDNALPESYFYKTKLIASFLKYQGLPDSLYLKFFDEGEKELINEQTLSKASLLTQYLFGKINFEYVQKRRRENYKLVYKLGLELNLNFLFSYNEKITPLNVPILVKNRDKIRKQLMGYNIFLPVHWMMSDYNQESIFVKKIHQEELSLVIDHRYSDVTIGYQLDMLIKSINYGK